VQFIDCEEGKMRARLFFQIVGFLFTGSALLLVANYSDLTIAQERARPTAEKAVPEFRRSIEDYRKAIKDAYHVDIANFKERLKGGRADGKPITKYDLKELVEGIRFEREHTDDSLLALEMAMDHLETIPDYYSRLHRMEKEVMSDKLLSH
jgi:uncharacterized protein DUF5661